MEIIKCEACGAEDSIYFTSDCGYCQECYTPENYTYIEVEDE